MKRREFIVNSLITVGGAALFGSTNPSNLFAQNKNNLVVTRKFKNLDIPLLSMGCMRLPLKNSEIDIQEVEKMVDYAFKHGVNYFDTAYMYHGGKSEPTMGNVLSNYKRSSFFLATKNPLRSLHQKSDIRRIFDEQLKRCKTDYFDFYLAHNISLNTIDIFRKLNVYEELLKIKEEGKIKHLGFSFHGEAPLLKEVIKDCKWEFCQIQLNYLDWTARDVKSNYELLTNAKIPVLPMTPVRGGALANLTGSPAALIRDKKPADTQASFALRWVAGRENCFTVLSGMSSLKQMQENVGTFTDYRPFSKEENELADRISQMLQKHGEINCTTCDYCQNCPRGIAIPKVFEMYNEYKASGDAKTFVKKYDSLSAKPDRCIKCGQCKEHCPQLLDVPTLLLKVKAQADKLKKGA